MAAIATINGRRVTRLCLHVPFVGAWTVEAEFDEAMPLSDLVGQARVTIGPNTLVGTFDPNLTGTYLHTSRCFIRAGAGSWWKKVRRREYHDDGLGIKSTTVIEDLARGVGETVGALAPGKERLGGKFEMREGPASEAMALACGAVPWWVDYDGRTHVGVRAAAEVAGAYEILDVDPEHKTAVVSADDPLTIGIGSILRQRLQPPLTVREMHVEIADGKVRTLCWGTEGSLARYVERSRLLRDLQAVARSAFPELPYLKIYRYRVVEANNGDNRWKLQAVEAANKLPDISPAAVHPGVAGLVAKLPSATQVLVQFVEGDPSMPVITHFAAPDNPGFIPTELAIQAGSTGVSPTEHATSIEAVANVLQNLMHAISLALTAVTPPIPLTTTALAALLISPVNAAYLNAALGFCATPGLPGTPGTGEITALSSAISAALAAKLPNATGLLPGVGWPDVRGG